MTISTFILVTSLVLALLPIWVLFLYVVPRHQTSRFRYRLWEIRDEVKDSVYRGELPDNDAVNILGMHVESFIRHAHETGLVSFLLVASANDPYRSDVEEAIDRSKATMSDGQLKLLSEYEASLYEEVLKHLVTGSLVGWLFGIFVAPIALVIVVARIVRDVRRRLRDSANWESLAFARIAFAALIPFIVTPSRIHAISVRDANITQTPIACVG